MTDDNGPAVLPCRWCGVPALADATELCGQCRERLPRPDGPTLMPEPFLAFVLAPDDDMDRCRRGEPIRARRPMG